MNQNDKRNLVILDGYMAEDTELTELEAGKKVANIRVATTESYKPEGATEYTDKVSYHPVTVWGKLAEYAAKNLKKGVAVSVWGKLVSNEKSVGKDGKTYYNSYVKGEVLSRGYNSQKEGKEAGEEQESA